ncbi:MAG TPA: urate hydroxylase PuuD [Kofleriaceae bacterium]|nr:urate hydroxylase PuuD [Kofleriaceae bacterium]
MSWDALLDVIFRWAHLVAGIMWIGNSMLWNWIDRNLEKHHADLGRLSQGKIFMVHSGAFYEMEKKLLEPGALPANLYWFKWQNGITWLTGIALLVVVYYFNGAAFLVDPAVAELAPSVAISLSVGSLFCAWIIYDGLWRTFGEGNPRLATVLSVVLLFGAIFGFAQVFSGRAAYIQTGVMIGTLMTGNVWMVIMPSQRELLDATKSGREQDPIYSIRAKQRSIHNNYFTFPLLFIMISNHFPGATTHPLNWAILIAVMIGGAGVRHFMNVRYRGEGRQLPVGAWLAPAVGMAGIAIAGLLVITRLSEKPLPKVDEPVTFARAEQIIHKRCLSCHSKAPADPSWPSAPSGVMFDEATQIEIMAPRIYQRAVKERSMPLNNKTMITDDERAELGNWIERGANLDGPAAPE